MRSGLRPMVELTMMVLLAACSDDGASSATGSSTNGGSGGAGTSGASVGAGSPGGSGVGGSGAGGSGVGGSGVGGSGVGGSGGQATGSGGSGGDGTGGAGGAAGPGLLSQASYDAVMVFPNHPVVYVPTGIAWDGTYFWVGGDGNLGGFTEVRYDAAGTYLSSYQPGVGFSSIYTKGDGTGPVFGRELTWNNVMQQQTPGQWAEPLTLAGGNPPTMTAVKWDADHSEYIALEDGTLHRWNTAGQSLPNIVFQGFGTANNEGAYPAGRRVAWAYGHYLTYSDMVISAWDQSGARVASATLNGAGMTDFDSALSFSFAQGKAWVVDSSQGSWRGYDITP